MRDILCFVRHLCFTFHWLSFNSPLSIGYALDPSVDTHQVSSVSYIGAVDEAEKNKGNLYFFPNPGSVNIFFLILE